MAISFPTGAGNTTTATGGSVNTLTLAKPANVADGDLLVCGVFFRNSGGTITAGAGFTQVGPLNTTYETFGLYFKAIPSAAGEAATSYTFSTSAGSSRAAGVLTRVTGVNLSTVADAAGSLAAYTGTTSIVVPAVSAVAGYTAILTVGITNNSVTGAPSLMTPPAGTTKLGEASGDNGTSATGTLCITGEIIDGAGSTGTRTLTVSPTAANSGAFAVTLTGIADVVAAPAVHPDAVVAAVGWAANTGTLVTAVGDASDSTYAESPSLTGSDTILRYKLPPLTPSPSGVSVTVRCALDVTTATTSTIKLWRGATLIKSWAITPDIITNFTVTALAADLTGVSDWGDLEVSVTAKI